MLTIIQMSGILSIRNKEAKKMVKCTHEEYKDSRLSSQLGQFYSFEGGSCECGRCACLFIFYQFSYKKTGGYPLIPTLPRVLAVILYPVYLILDPPTLLIILYATYPSQMDSIKQYCTQPNYM